MDSWEIPEGADEDRLIEDWIRFQYLHRDGKPIDAVIWAHAALDDMCDSHPQACFEMIQKVLVKDSSEMILSALAAGPLEDLLSRHGPAIIEEISSAATREPHIRTMLTGVWKSTIDPTVWDRVQEIVARGGVNQQR